MELQPSGLPSRYDEGLLDSLLKNPLKSYLIQSPEVKSINALSYIIEEDSIQQDRNYRNQFKIVRVKPEGIMHIDSIALSALSVFPSKHPIIDPYH